VRVPFFLGHASLSLSIVQVPWIVAEGMTETENVILGQRDELLEDGRLPAALSPYDQEPPMLASGGVGFMVFETIREQLVGICINAAETRYV
jgi:hypothetical protein